jgi:hypothetical protein
MWDNESQRIGMQKCWPLAYNIHAAGEFIGFVGLLDGLGTIGYMIYIAIFGDFTTSMWFLLLMPFGMGITSEVMVQSSWVMVAKRGFQYDYDKCEASWIQDGKRVSYQYAQQGGVSGASSAGDI